MKKEKNKIKSTKERSFIVNLIFCIVSLICMFIVPSLIGSVLHIFIKSEMLCTFLGDMVLIAILVLIYYTDLTHEWNRYKNDFKNNFKKGFKTYMLGFLGMVFCNIVIIIFLKDVSANENQVREMLFSSPIFTFLCIAIAAPIGEELVFRKSLQPVIKNKWIYVVICGLLFGGAHIMTNILNNAFVWTDLIYILPYGCLGSSFALMDYDTKSTFTSIVMHSMHNSLTGILLLVTYFGGNL